MYFFVQTAHTCMIFALCQYGCQLSQWCGRCQVVISFRTPPHVTPVLHSIFFTGFLLPSRGSNTSCLCFALRSFLIKPRGHLPKRFGFAITLLPGTRVRSSADGHLSVQNTTLPHKLQWSALFLLPGSNYLSCTSSLSLSFFPPQWFYPISSAFESGFPD